MTIFTSKIILATNICHLGIQPFCHPIPFAQRVIFPFIVMSHSRYVSKDCDMQREPWPDCSLLSNTEHSALPLPSLPFSTMPYSKMPGFKHEIRWLVIGKCCTSGCLIAVFGTKLNVSNYISEMYISFYKMREIETGIKNVWDHHSLGSEYIYVCVWYIYIYIYIYTALVSTPFWVIFTHREGSITYHSSLFPGHFSASAMY